MCNDKNVTSRQWGNTARTGAKKAERRLVLSAEDPPSLLSIISHTGATFLHLKGSHHQVPPPSIFFPSLHPLTNSLVRCIVADYWQHKETQESRNKHNSSSAMLYASNLIRWLQRKRYQYEVTFSLYMLTPTEKFIFSTFSLAGHGAQFREQAKA